MNVEEIARCLSAWKQVDTWHIKHPTDTKNFNRARSFVPNAVGMVCGFDEFKEAMNFLSEIPHPEQVEKEHMQQEIVVWEIKLSSILVSNNGSAQ